MTDYISREAAIKRLFSWREVIKENFGENDEYANCLEEAIDKIEDLPAADVRPVVRGKWECKEGAGQYYEVRCSVCGSRPPQDYSGWVVESNFCPNCGADMRSEIVEDTTSGCGKCDWCKINYTGTCRYGDENT